MLYALISHDVDHITIREHIFNDLVVEKFFIRSNIELLTKKISIKEYNNRILDIITLKKWNNIIELIKFNNEAKVESTFFVGVARGKGLSYHLKLAKWAIQYILEHNYDVGVHGIHYNNFDLMFKEFQNFKQISNLNEFGIRMHYLRNDHKTMDYINKIGYSYDGTLYEIKNPYWLTNTLLEIPIHIMDGWIILGNKRYQTTTFEQAKELTMRKIDYLIQNQINYISILFHDRYFSNSFITWRKWYEWLIEFLKENSFTFISHKNLYHNFLKKD